MSQELFFFKHKLLPHESTAQKFTLENICDSLKALFKHRTCDDPEIKDDLFETVDVSNINLSFYEKSIEPLMERNEYLLSEKSPYYLVDKELWDAIEKEIKKQEKDDPSIKESREKLEELFRKNLLIVVVF